MIDISTETLRTRVQSGEMLGREISETTWWRWRGKGVRGRVLESVTIGGQTYTSVEALQRFAEPRGDSNSQPRSPAKRRRAIEAAEATLAAAGI